MKEREDVCSSDLAGIYCDIANIIGVEATQKLYCCLRGQQVTFPIHLYSQEYVIRDAQKRKNQDGIGKLASEYGYTEKWLRQMLKTVR